MSLYKVQKQMLDFNAADSNEVDAQISEYGISVKGRNFNASGSIITTTGTIVSGSKSLTVSDTIDFKIGHGIRILNANPIFEIKTLTITSSAVSSGNVIIYFDETSVNIPVTNGSSTSTIASAIRGTTFSGWTIGGSGSVITFTANSMGKKLLYFVSNGTGVSNTMETTVNGNSDLVTTITGINGMVITTQDAATASVSASTVYHDDTEAINRAIDYIDNDKLVLPSGNYMYHYIDKVKDNIIIEGYGATLISYLEVGYAKNAFRINGTNVALRGINFKYDRSFNPDTTFKPQSFPGGNNHVRLGGARSDEPNARWCENITVDSISIDGGYGGGLDIYFANRCFIRKNTVRNTLGNGINFSNCQFDIFVEYNNIDFTRDDGIQNVCDNNWTNGTTNYQCRNNTVTNSYAKGISTTGVASGIIEKNYIKNTWTGGLQPFRDAFYSLGGTSEIICRENIIVDAGKNYGVGKYRTDKSSNCDAIYVSNNGTNFITFENNKIFSPLRHGVVVSSGSRGVKFRGNRIYTAGGKGFNIGNATDSTYTSSLQVDIVDNEIYDAWEEGILIGGSNEGTVENNYIKNWNRRNESGVNFSPIYLKNCKNIKVVNNRFNNETTGYINILVNIDQTGINKNIIETNNLLLTDNSSFAPNVMFFGGKKIGFVSGGKPSDYFWFQGDYTFETTPIIRGKVLYSCVRTGRAAALWTPSSTVTVGSYVQPISDNGQYYVCTTEGTTGSAQPTWNSGAGSFTNDGTVVWQQVGTCALFRPIAGIDEEKTGTFSWTSDGTSNHVDITHNLGSGTTPNKYFVTPASLDAGNAGIKYVAADSTKLTVYFNNIPTSGLTIRFNWNVGL